MTVNMAKAYPEPAVGAFILNGNNEILLIKSPKWSNQWTVPGGHVELNETIQEAVEREVKEETGVDVEFVEVFNVQESIADPKFHMKKHFIFLDCLCRAKTFDITLDGREAKECRWFTLKEALRLPAIAPTVAIPLQERLIKRIMLNKTIPQK